MTRSGRNGTGGGGRCSIVQSLGRALWKLSASEASQPTASRPQRSLLAALLRPVDEHDLGLDMLPPDRAEVPAVRGGVFAVALDPELVVAQRSLPDPLARHGRDRASPSRSPGGRDARRPRRRPPFRNRRRGTANAQSPGISVGTMLAPWISIRDRSPAEQRHADRRHRATAPSAASGLGTRW